MELAKGGEVFDKLLEFGSLTEPEAARLISQVLSTIFIYMGIWETIPPVLDLPPSLTNPKPNL